MKKQNIYIDVDDVILNTSEIIIQKINEKYGTHKTFFDLKDWEYKSIYRNLDYNYIIDLFESQEFFEKVKINEEFIKLYKKTKRKINWILFTQGTKKNLELKKEFFQKRFKNINIIAVNENKNEEKRTFDLHNGIQIDDVYSNLKTNAQIKILLKNNIETNYNQVKDYNENLYICNTWQELSEIIVFFIKNPKFKEI